MSTTIDERVVEMRFDNKQFEQNVQTSLTTLDKLKQGLDLDGAAKGLEGLGDAAKKVSFDPIGRSVEAVQAKFSALEVMAMTALSNITNSVVNAGKRIISQFTIEPVTTGFNEYELKMGSVQTIMASTGESLDTVNKKLDELNTYSDKTIYSFSDMTQNIGKFTNAGVKLNDAVAAIQGVSNVAAISGANASEASRAMYNFAQALSAGYVKLIDWKSIENANMATVEFKNQLLEAAVAAGTVEKTADGMYKVLSTNAQGSTMDGVIDATHNFNDSLSYQWMTTEVLTSTLKAYSDETTEIGKKAFAAAQDVKTFSQLLNTLKESAQSGWAETWQLIVGDFEEAKDTLREFNTFFDAIISGFSKARNELLSEGLSKSSGFTNYLSELTGMTNESISSLRTLGKESGYRTEEFAAMAGEISNGSKATQDTVVNLLAMVDTEKDVITYLHDMTGAEEENIEKLHGLGTVSNYNSEEYKKLLDTLSKGNPVMAEVITNMLKYQDSGKDVAEFIKEQTGATDEAIQKVRDFGKETGYTSKEFQDYVNVLAEGDEAMAKQLTELAKFSDSGKDATSYIAEMTGALESDVEQLKKFGKESGYASDDYKKLLNSISKGDPVMAALIDRIVQMEQSSGRVKLFDAILNGLKGLQKIFSTIGNAWEEVFPPMTGDRLYEIVTALKALSERLIISDETADKISRTFKGLFSVLDIAKQAFSAVFNAISPLFGGLSTLSGGILDVTASFGDWLVELDNTVKQGDIFNKVVEKISGFIKEVSSRIKEFYGYLKEKFNFPGFELLSNLLSGIKERFTELISSAMKVKDKLSSPFKALTEGAQKSSGILTFMTSLFTAVKNIVGGIINAVSTLVSGIAEKLGSADFSTAIDLLNGISFGAIALGIKSFLEDIRGAFGDAEKIIPHITSILDSVKGCFDAWQQSLKADVLLKIAGAIGVITLALIALSGVDSEKLNASLGALTVMFIDLIGAMAGFSRVEGDAKKMDKSAKAMIEMSASVLILAVALKKIADLEPEQLKTGLIGIASLSGILVAAMTALSAASSKYKEGSMKGLISFAATIGLLTISLNSIAKLDSDQIQNGLIGLAGLAAIMGTTMSVMKAVSSKYHEGSMKGLISFAAAIGLLTLSLKSISDLKPNELQTGMVGIAGLAATMGTTMSIMKAVSSKYNEGSVKGLISFAASIGLLVLSLKGISDLNPDELKTGMEGIAGLAATMATTLTILQVASSKCKEGSIKGLLSFAASIGLLTISFQSIANLNTDQIIKGLSGVAGLAATMVVALSALAGVSKAFNVQSFAGIAGAMVLMASSILILTPAMAILGGMSWESIVKGLAAIAGAFTVLGVAATVLAPLTTTVLALAGAFALIGAGAVGIGAGLTLIGVGLSAIATGITALAVSMGAGVTAIVAGLTAIVTGVAALIPALAEKFGEAIVAFCGVIIDGAPAIGEAIKALVLTLVDVLVECVPEIASGALQLISEVLAALVTYTPQIVESIMQFLIELLNGVAEKLPELIQAAVNVIASFFKGIVDALKGIDTTALLEGIAGVGLMAGIMTALAAVAALVPGAMVGVLGMGAVIAELALVLAAVGALAQIPGLSWLIGEGGKLLQGIGTAIGGFVGGIVGGFMSGVSSQFPQIGADLSAFMTNIQPFIDGAKSIGPDTMNGVKSLTEVILALTAADILQGLTSWLTGGSSMADFANQLVPFGEAMTGFSNAVAGMDADLVGKAAIAGKTLAEMAATLPNSGGVFGFFAGENDMSAFGAQLVPFGAAMLAFSIAVKGMDADAVTNAAIAGKALAEMAATLPNSGGVLGFFAGENDMTAFGAQLVPFGRAMKSYSLAVKGLDTDAIANSTTAGKALIELANTLPNCGGVVGFFTGDNDLSTFGSQILVFGQAMNEYSQAVSGIDSAAVTNSATAGKALVELANTIPNTGGLVSFFTGDNSIADFGNQLKKFGQSMSDYYSTISNIDTGKLSSVVTQVWSLIDLAKGAAGVDTASFGNFGKSLTALADTGINGFTTAFYDCGAKVNKAVLSMLDTVSTCIESNISNVTPAMDNLMKSLIKSVDNSTKTMGTSVTQMMVKFSTQIKANSSTVTASMTTVLTNTLNSINKNRSLFEKAGQNVGQGFVVGIKSMLSSATSAGRSLGLAALNAAKRALDSHSPSKEFIHLGENMGEGLAIGAQNSIVPASQATSKMIGEVIKVSKNGLESFKTWAEEKKYYGELSLMDELAGYEQLQKRYKAGSKERTEIDREVYRIQNELVASTYQASMDWIEEEKYYNRLSLEEELAAYERVQARYLEGSEERKKADREVYRLRNELIQQSYQNSMNWIEQEKYYNRMSLAEELAAYKRVQSRYAAGTDERTKMDREVYRVEQEIYEAQEQYIQDVQRVQSNANQRRLQLEQDYADKVESINNQLASDIKSANDQYLNELESRTNTLYQSYGLFDEVKEREEVSGETLMKNLEGQVKEFGEWQDILDELSGKGVDSELIEELQQMGPSAISQIEALNEMSDEELEKYVSLWSVKHAQAREQAVGELEGLRQETLDTISQLRADADAKLAEYRNTWQANLAQVTADANAELEQLRKDFGEKVGLIETDTDAKMEEMAETAQRILTEAGWDEAGQAVVTGIVEGIESEKQSYLDTLTQMAIDGVNAVKETWDEHSPSRVFKQLGAFAGEGLVNGLIGYSTKTYAAGVTVAEYAQDGLASTIQMISDIIDAGIDTEPTIRPVIDLSRVSNGVNDLNAMFSAQRALGLAASAGLTFMSEPGDSTLSINVDNGGVVDEIHSLRNDMAEMIDRIERMRIVMDTGALVGQMAAPMDNALGQRQIYRGRGN